VNGNIIYGNVIASSGLYGCEIWSLPIREDHRLSKLDVRDVWRFLRRTREDETKESAY
jgi:hypothetical protein